MPVLRIANRSRLRFSQYRRIDGITFWDLLEIPDVPEQPDDIQHAISGLDRIDLLAKRFYNDVTLYPIIAVANGWELVPTELVVGTTIRIPSPRYVLDVFFNQRNNR